MRGGEIVIAIVYHVMLSITFLLNNQNNTGLLMVILQ